MVRYKSMNGKSKSQQVSVVIDPRICHGKPVISGTRIMVWQILELLELGESLADIHEAFPTLPQGAVEAALRFAADRARSERYVAFTDEKTPAYLSA